MSTFEIMFDDLKPEAQQALLEFDGVQSPSDCNYEIVPVCVLERDDQTEIGGVENDSRIDMRKNRRKVTL